MFVLYTYASRGQVFTTLPSSHNVSLIIAQYLYSIFYESCALVTLMVTSPGTYSAAMAVEVEAYPDSQQLHLHVFTCQAQK